MLQRAGARHLRLRFTSMVFKRVIHMDRNDTSDCDIELTRTVADVVHDAKQHPAAAGIPVRA